MKIQKQAFTLIELMVVTTILILISVTSVFYFSWFIDSFKLKTELWLVENIIKNFDTDIHNKKSYDYEMQFKAWEGFFITYQNIFDIPNYLTWSFDAWTWTLNIEPTLTWFVWQVKIYNDYKILLENFVRSDEPFTYTFKDYTYYNIISYLWTSRINDIILNYYSPDNLSFDDALSLNLSEIKTITWTWITDLVIKNIGWRKEIIWDWTVYDSVYLFFSKQWAEEKIIIKK